jgi:hypothetical protein
MQLSVTLLSKIMRSSKRFYDASPAFRVFSTRFVATRAELFLRKTDRIVWDASEHGQKVDVCRRDFSDAMDAVCPVQCSRGIGASLWMA